MADSLESRSTNIYQSSYAEVEKGEEKMQLGSAHWEKKKSHCVEGTKFTFSRHEFYLLLKTL